MAILNSDATLTTSQKQAKAKTQLNAVINGLYKQMLAVYNGSMGIVWQNADGLTPQEVFNAFGTDAGELARLAVLLKTTLNTAKANTVPEPTVLAFTVNNDGTVTVS